MTRNNRNQNWQQANWNKSIESISILYQARSIRKSVELRSTATACAMSDGRSRFSYTFCTTLKNEHFVLSDYMSMLWVSVGRLLLPSVGHHIATDYDVLAKEEEYMSTINVCRFHNMIEMIYL